MGAVSHFMQNLKYSFPLLAYSALEAKSAPSGKPDWIEILSQLARTQIQPLHPRNSVIFPGPMSHLEAAEHVRNIKTGFNKLYNGHPSL